MSEWIDDRLPTEDDCNDSGWVMIPCAIDSDGWEFESYEDIQLGDAWAPSPKMPPYEPELAYWSKPSDIPADARWFLEIDGDCDMIQTVTIWGLILARDIRITWEELSEWRWSDRPFDRFEDGKPCTKGCSGEN